MSSGDEAESLARMREEVNHSDHCDHHTRVTPMAGQLEYVADMILELREIAERADLRTLAGILDLAHSEARLQAGCGRDR